MKHVSILVTEGQVIVDTIIAPFNLLRMANAYYKRINGTDEDLLKVDLVGLSTEPVVYQGLFTIKPTTSILELLKTDMILVSAIDGDLEKQLEKNRMFVSWIRKQRIENDAEVASLCKGAIILAETGLLNGKTCSTHWTVHDKFREMYPQVNLVPEKIISEDGGVFSSGGAYSFLNFMLYIIERYFGREVAIWCSKISEIDIDRIDQSEFMVFSGQKEHPDEAILNAQNYIESNYDQKLNVSDLAELTNMNNRSFLRRFKKATSNTPIEYIQRVKVEAAKKKLESTTNTILEIMFGVGYNDEKAFRNTFRKYSGLTPKEYQVKYNREMAFT